MAAKNTSPAAPVLIRSFKKEAELEVWKLAANGRYVHIKTFPICRWSGQLGPKQTQGDRQTPEGFYPITRRQMNPNSHYYLSFDTGFPNAYDKAHGATGSALMVHGTCSSAGCYAMTDKQIGEIYAIAREAFAGGQQAFQFQAFPFRLTAQNMVKYRTDKNIDFWRQLKEGSDRFEATGEEPVVSVAAGRYAFAPSRNPAKEATAKELPRSGGGEDRRADRRRQRGAAHLLFRWRPASGLRGAAEAGRQSRRCQPARGAGLCRPRGDRHSRAKKEDRDRRGKTGGSAGAERTGRLHRAADPGDRRRRLVVLGAAARLRDSARRRSPRCMPSGAAPILAATFEPARARNRREPLNGLLSGLARPESLPAESLPSLVANSYAETSPSGVRL